MDGLHASVCGGESLAVLQDARERLEEPCLWHGEGVTRHPKLGAVERRMALLVNFLTSRSLRKLRRSGALFS